ncbi:MAG: Cobyrinic acid ac-diamide synthase [Promethearchaeota archaeon CR_4]|nr:MAG: Cobyrinic acid ac-diamide synthase [Candidatus Lokiarchaeota archaeon CR_4]
MKIAVAGKGGTGKTLITGTLAHIFARNGYKVLAIDNDASMNLAFSIGIPEGTRKTMVPISKMSELIKERTGIDGADSGIYNVNPQVSDIPDQFVVVGPNGIKLLALGTIETPSSGCLCPGNALIRTLLYNLFIKRNEVVLVDFEAGLEHLGRGTAKGVDLMAIVTEPSQKSLELSLKIGHLARELGIKNIGLIFNKMRDEHPIDSLTAQIPSGDHFVILGNIPFDEEVVQADLRGESIFLRNPRAPVVQAIEGVYGKISALFNLS